MSIPVISILTPTYEARDFLTFAVRSVHDQQLAEVEHVVADGASTDGTPEYLESVGHDIEWLSRPDRGQSDALNRALARARGEWIGWLNADEFYLPGSLARALQEIDGTDADVIYGDFIEVYRDGRFKRLVPEHRFDLRVLRARCFIGSCTVFIRRSVLSGAPWHVGYRLTMDWDLFLRLAQDGAEFKYVRWPVAGFTRHPGQVTARAQPDEWREVLEVLNVNGLPPTGSQRRMNDIIGNGLHSIHKVVDGGYRLQLMAHKEFRGRRLSWESDQEMRALEVDLRRLYRRAR